MMPDHWLIQLYNYRDRGIEPGEAVKAILSCDLREVCSKVDKHFLTFVPEFLSYAMTRLPKHTYGSMQSINAWVRVNKKRMLAEEKLEEERNETGG